MISILAPHLRNWTDPEILLEVTVGQMISFYGQVLTDQIDGSKHETTVSHADGQVATTSATTPTPERLGLKAAVL